MIYLRFLRAIILVIATILILYTAYLAVSGLYRVAQSPSSVREAVASVAANEISDAEQPEAVSPEAGKGPVADSEQQKFYSNFVERYFRLFHTKFEPFRQPEDKVLSRDEFDDSFVQSAARLNAATAGSVTFSSDRADLESLLAAMTAAAVEPRTIQRLRRYKAAKKVAVQRQIRKTRIEYRRGWNSLSTSCDGWFYSPIGCAERRAVEVPYSETTKAMEFPKGTQSHSQIFHAMQDKFFTLLENRRSSNAATAEARRIEIAESNVRGSIDLSLALRIFGGFIALMFFFLLIAIERHQRRIAATIPIAALPERAGS
ncbi:hypothetical protein [Sphingomonas hengshuiensis]|uniref:hypothetical protein n=1 Tax=Sphingomonas hengshuiensis TaxID=1609977 RepID=UPI0012B89A1B|nr:hypothetical protein [Sphingomonas hengshuiensis]